MRSRSARPWLVVLLAAGLAVLVPGLVMADDVVVSGNVITIVGGVRTVTITSGGSATVSYYIEARGGDNQLGCNASDGSPARLTFWIESTQLGPGSTPVAASPASLTFTSCRQGNNFNAQSVTFSSSTPGVYVITVQVEDSGSGQYDTSRATFTLTVQPPPLSDSTPPVITPTITGTVGHGGWYVSDVTVSWTVTDPESSVTSTSGCGTTTITTDTSGVTLTCTATSAGGTRSESVTIKRDATPPQVVLSCPADPVAVGASAVATWTASDAGSGVAGATSGQLVLDTSQVGTRTATLPAGSVQDVAGNGSAAASCTYEVIDPTPPEISYTVSGTLGTNGWYVSDVTVSWTVTDPESSVTSTTGCETTWIDTDTSGVTLTCTATSAGGASSVSVTIKRDATPPQVSCTLPAQDIWYGDNVSVSCSATDATSGLADAADASFVLSTSVAAGEERADAQTDSRDVVDQAGNRATAGPYSFRVDRKAPVVSCAPSTAPVTSDGWYGDNVTVTCTASDGGSGLADAADASFVLSTSVAAGEERADAQTGSRDVVDQAGNRATAGPYSFRVDRKAPVVMLTCPAQPILQNTSDVFAEWTASDEGSGVDGATSGQIALDTSQVGTRTATLPAGSVRDRVGNQSAAASCTYSVIYRWSGFFRPVDNPHIWNVVNAGRAVPIKFSLAGFQGMDILSGSPRVVFVPCTNGESDPVEEFASTSGNSGLQYDPLTDQYIYVWKTDRNWAGKCAKFVLTLKDGTSHEAWFRFTR